MIKKYYNLFYNKIIYFIALYLEVILDSYPFIDDTFIYIYGIAYYVSLIMTERKIDIK
jgi:hypothetical protein